MTTKGYINDFYKQFEELSYKLYKADLTIKRLSETISMQVGEIRILSRRLETEKQKKQELLLEVKKLKNINKNNGKPKRFINKKI